MRDAGLTDEQIEIELKPYFDDDTIQAIMQEVAGGASAIQEAANGAIEQLSAADQEQLALLQVAVDEAKAKMDELAQAYEKAYDAAYSSISGQLKLFTELDKPKEKDLMDTKQMIVA